MSDALIKIALDTALVRAVAKAILETDPTCDYEICEARQKAGGREADFNREWWESLHEQAIRAIETVREFGK